MNQHLANCPSNDLTLPYAIDTLCLHLKRLLKSFSLTWALCNL